MTWPDDRREYEQAIGINELDGLIRDPEPCHKCSRQICHNHGSAHIPHCWPCIHNDGIHMGFQCLCERLR